jgi:hypothetical protein
MKNRLMRYRTCTAGCRGRLSRAAPLEEADTYASALAYVDMVSADISVVEGKTCSSKGILIWIKMRLIAR